MRDVDRDRRSLADVQRELRRSEHRLRTVLESAADIVVFVGPGGEILEANGAAADRLGDDGATAPSVLSYVHPDDADLVGEAIDAALAVPGRIPPITFRIRHTDGSWREYEGSGANLLDDPDVEALVIGLRDVTQQRAVERTFLRLHRLNRVLAEANEAVMRATDPLQLLHAACRIAVSDGGLVSAVVAMRDDTSLRPCASFGVDMAALRRLRPDFASLPSPAYLAEVVRRNEPLLVPDVATGPDDGWRDVNLAMGMRSALHLPLLVGGEACGALSVWSDAADFFDGPAAHLLARLASSVSLGLSTLDAAQRRAEADAALTRRGRQQAEVARLGQLALTAQDVADVAEASVLVLTTCLDADAATVARLEPGGERFHVIAGIGWPEGVVGREIDTSAVGHAVLSMAERRAVVVEDLATDQRFDSSVLASIGITAGVTVPLEVDGRAWGVVAVHSSAARHFDTDDVSVVQAVANILAGVIASEETLDRLRHQTLHDPLTGLPNRVLVEDRIDRALERQRRGASQVVLAVVDVDGFRLVNDTLGVQAGDDLLRAVAQRLALVVRPGDTVGRLAADEFAVVREDVSEDDAAEDIRVAFAEPVDVGGRPIAVSVAVGTAMGSTVGADLLQQATAALHEAKADGRGRHRRYDAALEVDLANRFDLHADLAQALGRGELELWYQPVVDTATGSVVGAEALLRWHHPTRGLVPPSEFIPVAEETGIIVPVGAWVLSEACRQAAPWVRWAVAAGRRFSVAVNLSAVQLTDPDLVGHVARSLRAHDLEPDALCLEITESVLFAERDGSTSVLRRLRDLGVDLVVDDFGTGFSSLGYLQRFPITGLKIDRTFTATLARGRSPAIVEAIIGMADALGLGIIAEGVEVDEQREVLLELGCTYAQGWLFGRPVVAADFERVLKASAAHVERRRPRRAPDGADAPDDDPSHVSARVFRRMVDGATDLVSVIDHERRHLYVNHAVERLLGMSSAEILGRTHEELGLPEDTTRDWADAARAVLLTGQPLEVSFSHAGPDGELRFASRLVPEVVDGRVVTVTIATRDVTNYRQSPPSIPAMAALDETTSLLSKAAFLRVVHGVRHAEAGFDVVHLRVDAAAVEPAALLAEAAACLGRHLRPGDVAVRWGPAELAVLLHPSTPESAAALAAALHATFTRPYVVTVLASSPGETPTDVLARRPNAVSPAPRATGSAAPDATSRRRASSGVA